MKYLPLFSILAACAGGAKDERVTTILGLEGDVTSGESLFTAHCSACHGADATGGSGPSLVGKGGEGSINTTLNGEEDMPAFADSLEDQDIADIWAWIDTL